MLSNSFMSNGTKQNNNHRRLVVLSDKFTIQLIKSYMDSKTFTIVRVGILDDLCTELAKEGQKRCVFFDEDYESIIRQYIALNQGKERQLLLVHLKRKPYILQTIQSTCPSTEKSTQTAAS
jgi:hypothetical protein